MSCNVESVKDIDGNRYNTIAIGEQVWIKENLKVTRLSDGSQIQLISDNNEWTEATGPAFCWYNNDPVYKNEYGALYNWYAIQTGRLCPEGWHVSSDSEWTDLRFFLEQDSFGEDTGSKLKEKGTKHWKSPNSEATNESGFTALPGGYRSYTGAFSFLGASGYWWTSTQFQESNAYFWNLRYKYEIVYKYISTKTNGFSVRCVSDERLEVKK